MLLRQARRLTVFTGAGVSAESGVPTFRDDDGFWEKFPVEQFGTLKGLVETSVMQPARLAAFVAGFVGPVADAAPNAAHVAIADMQTHVPTTVITQNVDGLHQEAGSQRVLQIHGSLLEVVNLAGEPVRTLTRLDLGRLRDRLRRAEAARFPLPHLLAALRPLWWSPPARIARPRVVFFGEGLAEPDWERAQRAAARCDVMLVVGTSALVEPASLLPLQAMTAGASVIWVDPRPAGIGLWLQGRAGEVVPRLLGAAFH